MADYNKVTLMGRLTRNPEVKTNPASTLAEFGFAVNKGKVDRKSTMYIECTAWGQSADFVGQYIVKGSNILVEGELRFDAWEDKDGSKRSKHKLDVYRVVSLGKSEAPAEEPEDDDAVPF